MARGKSIEDESTLQMALVGYQIEKEKIEARIRELQAQLKGKRGAAAPAQTAGARAPRARRELSAAARARIAAAQKKRWAEHRKRQAQAAKTVKAQAAS
jgi:cell division septum initiation protein DivIVA